MNSGTRWLLRGLFGVWCEGLLGGWGGRTGGLNTEREGVQRVLSYAIQSMYVPTVG